MNIKHLICMLVGLFMFVWIGVTWFRMVWGEAATQFLIATLIVLAAMAGLIYTFMDKKNAGK